MRRVWVEKDEQYVADFINLKYTIDNLIVSYTALVDYIKSYLEEHKEKEMKFQLSAIISVFPIMNNIMPW